MAISTFKIVIAGTSGVGKSSILMQYTDGYFIEGLPSTMGVDFRFKRLEIGIQPIKLQIWDTAGQERFRAVSISYYRSANGILLVYDLTRPETFERLTESLKTIREITGVSVPIVLVGNKSDSERKISYQDASDFAREQGLSYIEVSAKSGENVSACFEKLAALMLDMCKNVLLMRKIAQEQKATDSESSESLIMPPTKIIINRHKTSSCY